MNKYISVFTSPRFLQLLLVAVLQSLVVFNLITSEQGEGLINILSALFVGSVAIRTIDKNIGEPKMNNTTVSMPATVTSVTAQTKKSTSKKK
jgi:hypothetical protein